MEVAGPLSLLATPRGGGIIDEAEPAASLTTTVAGGGTGRTLMIVDDTLGASGAPTTWVATAATGVDVTTMEVVGGAVAGAWVPIALGTTLSKEKA